MSDRFNLALMVRDSLADWRAQLGRRFPRAPKGLLYLFSWFCLPLALRFGLELRHFHGRIGEVGLGLASRELLERYYAGVTFSADEGSASGSLAGRGPVLVLANHPGVVDSLALMWALETRFALKDFVVVANERDFFAAMPRIRDRIIPVPDGPGRAAVLPRIEAALAAGRSVVLYPSGDITNDPGLAPDIYPYESLLGTWSPSVGLLIARARRRSETGRCFTVLPLICGGVLPPQSADAWWMGSARSRRERETLAVASILAFGAGRRATVAVRAGRPLDPVKDLAGLSPKELGAAVYRSAAETAEALARELHEPQLFQTPSAKIELTTAS